MAKQNGLYTGVSESADVDVYINKLKHPMKEVVEYLRKSVLNCDKNIGEGIYWNAPAFYYTGRMEEFDIKEYKRYIVGMNLFRKDEVRLIFLRGAIVPNEGGLLEGDYKDGRRLCSFGSVKEVKAKEKELKKIVKALLGKVNS